MTRKNFAVDEDLRLFKQSTLEKLISDEEVKLLLDELLSEHGYDFTHYSKASMKRRINRIILLDELYDLGELRYNINYKPGYLRHFIAEITVNVSEMFRDPSFYEILRMQILPVLGALPFIKIWHAGCSTGEEVYSMAILLKEANLIEKSLLYATDINPDVLENLRKGIFPLGQIKQFSENYIKSGGKKDFSSYYTAKYSWAKFSDAIHPKMVVSTHNLVSDSSFNEFQLILCRNVLIYFERDLQNKVFQLFDQSLEQSGFLCLGAKETMNHSSLSSKYRQLEGKEKVWIKTG